MNTTVFKPDGTNTPNVTSACSPSISEELASRAPFAWTFQRRRDFAQSLLEDDGGGCGGGGNRRRNTEPSLSCRPLTRVPSQPTKKPKTVEIKTQNVGRAL